MWKSSPVIAEIFLHDMTNRQCVSITSRWHGSSVGGLKWKWILEPWDLLDKDNYQKWAL